MPVLERRLVEALMCLAVGLPFASDAKSPARPAAEMGRDLMEVTTPKLHDYYAQHKYQVR